MIIPWLNDILTKVKQIVPYTEGTIIGRYSGTGNYDSCSCSSPSSSNTFSAWAQNEPSITQDRYISHIIVTHSDTTTNQPQFVVEIGTGASGSETTIIRLNGLLMRTADGGDLESCFAIYALPIPIKVPSGSRISQRVSDSYSTTNTYYISIAYYINL